MNDNNYYDEITRLYDGPDIKKMLKRWSNFANNKPVGSTFLPVVLPDMLWVAKSRYGITSMLEFISCFLSEKNLVDFYGDVKFFEFDLEYSNPDSGFSSIDKFNDALLDASGFRSEFRGIVCVDVSEWIDHISDRYFIKFLEYLSDNTDIWHIIFIVDTQNKNKLNALEATLSMFFRIEKVEFDLPTVDSLFKYMENRLEKHGFRLANDAKGILLETVRELSKGKYFDGYNTLNMICSDLIYREFSSDTFSSYVITAETVKYYAKDSDFVVKAKTNIEKRRRIGFLSEGDNNEKL